MILHLADTPVLTTKRLTLRAPHGGDADAFVRFFATDRAFGSLGRDRAFSYFDPQDKRSIKLVERLGVTQDAAAKGPARRDPAAPKALVYRHSSRGTLQ